MNGRTGARPHAKWGGGAAGHFDHRTVGLKRLRRGLHHDEQLCTHSYTVLARPLFQGLVARSEAIRYSVFQSIAVFTSAYFRSLQRGVILRIVAAMPFFSQEFP